MADKKQKNNGIKVEIQIPEGVEVSAEGRGITVKGSQGELTKKLQSRVIELTVEGGKIMLTASRDRKRQRALINTERGNISNMIRGVTDKITYKLKVCYSHFPVGIKTHENNLIIDNFLGEKHPRKALILGAVEVDINGPDITLTGIDKDNVAQTAANIEQTTKIKNLDPRVFQDGIYIVEKDGKSIIK